MPGRNPDQDGLDERISKAVNGVMRKARGNPTNAIKLLLDENHDLREERRTLRGEVAELKKSVPEGAVVAQGEQAGILNLLSGLKIDSVEKLQALLDKPKDLQGEIDRLNLDLIATDVAEISGLPVRVVKNLVKAEDLIPSVEERTETVDGKEEKRRVALFTSREKDAKPVLVLDHIKGTEYEKLVESQGSTTTTRGVQVPRQPHTTTGKIGATGGGSKLVDDLLKKNAERAAAPNPLKPQTAN